MYKEEKLEDSKLMTLLADGSEYAFKILYSRYSNRIYKQAVRYLKSPVLAQEIVQDVFLSLWFERTKMKTDSPVEAWLITVAKNKLINQFRKLAKENSATVFFEKEFSTCKLEAEKKLMNAELEKLGSSIINLLPQMQKQVYYFAKVEDLSYNEIADRLNISPLTVKTHMARALYNIRKSLKQYGITASLLLMQFLL